MKFFFISEAGDGAGIALRVQEEGNEVAIQIHDDEAIHRCDGLVDKIHDWSFVPDRDVVVVSDCTGNGALCDMLRLGGFPVVGGGAIADRLEMDRGFATQVARDCGLRVPWSKEFDDWDKAREFLVDTDKEPLVFKPSAEFSGNLPSYADAESNRELLKMLDFFESHIKGKPSFVLQEFVEGKDISTEGWFNGTKFLRPFNHTLESKHLMEGNTGPSGGCTGNVVWACEDEGCPLCEALSKVESFLENSGYVGPLDLNAVVDRDGVVWWLEFTPRMGYDAAPTLLYELLDGEVGSFLQAVARAGAYSEDVVRLKPGFAAGIRLSRPPWPSEKFNAEEGIPIAGLRGEDKRHFYPYDVKYEDGMLQTCGAYGIIGVATGYGSTIEEAFEEAYRIEERIKMPAKQRRSDLAEVFAKNYRKINNSLKAIA